MTKYKVSEISAISPEMEDPEFEALVADIKQHGQLVPIWVRGNEVIDGRKRLEACKRLGIEPRVVNLEPDQDPAALSRSMNLLRTHYTPGQRAMIAAQFVNATAGTGMARKFAHLPKDHRMPSGRRLLRPPRKTYVGADEAGAALGVHRASVFMARRIRRDAAPELVAAVESGAIPLRTAIEILKEYPLDQQAAAIPAKLAQRHAAPAHFKKPPGHKSERTRRSIERKLSGFKRSPERAAADQIEMAIEKIEFTVGHIDGVLGRSEIRVGWAKRLRKTRVKLTRIIHIMEKA